MKLARWFFLLLIAGHCAAEDIEIVGQIDQTIKLPGLPTLRAPSAVQHISLLKIQLSPKARQTLTHRAIKISDNVHLQSTNMHFPKNVQLGMNHVPVLNQGSHGSCVTFANTAAVDAALNKGDYVSQLCQLELGLYLEKNAYSSSGWNGSWGPNVLNQMRMFGIVNKEQQYKYGCQGLTEYPLSGPDPDEELSVQAFHAMSESLPQDSMGWSSLLDLYQVAYDHADMNRVLDQVKATLDAGDRLTFGVLFLDFDQGTVGAVGSFHATNDSWVLTPEIAQDINSETEFAGHEMVITGYNDRAVAYDAKGRAHQGLLTLRNSWGSSAGHQGDFYMSYDYFKTLALEVQRIRTLIAGDVVEPTEQVH